MTSRYCGVELMELAELIWLIPAFPLLEAVSKGTRGGGHGVSAYHYGEQPALALFCSSQVFNPRPFCIQEDGQIARDAQG